MRPRSYWIAGAALAVLAAGIGYRAWVRPGGPDVSDPDEADKPAADFAFPDLRGKSLRLSDLRGKTVLLDFWATWCGPCVEDIPTLNALERKFKDRGFTVLGVSIDEAGPKEVAAFVKEHQLSYPVVLTGGQDNIPEGYGVFGLPTAYLIDPSGVIRQKYYGPKSEEEVEKDVEGVLGHARS